MSSDQPVPSDRPMQPDEMRASDRDRERVAEQLHSAAADGRITMDELGERLGVLYEARTYGELVPLTHDLPTGAPGAAPVRPASPSADGRSGPTLSIAVMSGYERGGNWVVPAHHRAVAFMGGVDLDLRDARFAAAEVVIDCVAVMGGIEITVAHDMDVEVQGFGFMGGFDGRGAGERPGGQRVRIRGVALMGGVEVKRAAPPEIEGSADPPKEITR